MHTSPCRTRSNGGETSDGVFRYFNVIKIVTHLEGELKRCEAVPSRMRFERLLENLKLREVEHPEADPRQRHAYSQSASVRIEWQDEAPPNSAVASHGSIDSLDMTVSGFWISWRATTTGIKHASSNLYIVNYEDTLARGR